MGRYGGSLAAARKNRGLWSVHLWERTCLAMEQDMLKGSGFVKKIALEEPLAADGSAGSTDPRPLQFDEKALKQCCGNAVVISCMTLQQRTSQRVVDLIVTLSEPLDEYHAHQSR